MIDVKKLREDLMGKDHTLYCSVMAHIRGKLHMTKLYGSTLSYIDAPWNFKQTKERLIDKRREMYVWTMEDQAAYVAYTIDKYTIEKEKEE